jgi:hypothetical protein
LIIGTASLVCASDLIILDGDTIKSNGITYRLIGFDTPERGDRALCNKERELAETASARLSTLVSAGEVRLRQVACACKVRHSGQPLLQLRPLVRSNELSAAKALVLT